MTKKLFWLGSLLGGMLLFTSCKVNWFGDTLDVPWYYIAIPILLIAGQDDPVGNYGKSVKKVYKKYKECGMQDVKLRLYENDRHEILNELDREIVFVDICKWLEKRR